VLLVLDFLLGALANFSVWHQVASLSLLARYFLRCDFLVNCCRLAKVFPAPNILPPLLFFVRLLSCSAFVGFSRTARSCESEQVGLIFPLPFSVQRQGFGDVFASCPAPVQFLIKL
jgi:hypothetical protein